MNILALKDNQGVLKLQWMTFNQPLYYLECLEIVFILTSVSKEVRNLNKRYLKCQNNCTCFQIHAPRHYNHLQQPPSFKSNSTFDRQRWIFHPKHNVWRTGFDADFSIKLGRWVWVHASHRHEVAEVGAVLLVCLALPLCSEMTGGPAAYVACAVDCAELLRLCRHMQTQIT